MKGFIYFFIGLLVFLFACEGEKEEAQEFSNADLVITSGYICGWCSGADSLVISKDVFAYVAFNPCGQDEDDAISEKSGPLTDSQWQELVQSFDFDDFSSIDINTCNVCFDGCDYWVKVKQGEEVHKITFGHRPDDSTAIELILPFIEKLDELKAELIAE